MSTPVNPGSPEQQAKKVKRKKIFQSQFRSFLLLAAIYSLIIHHVQKNSPELSREVIKEVTKQEVKSPVNETNGVFDISGWNFRNASYLTPRDFRKPRTESYGDQR